MQFGFLQFPRVQINSLLIDLITRTEMCIDTARGYHGYWAKDLYRVNPRFGTAQDLKQLVRECHKRDVRAACVRTHFRK
jgi:alpha-amylase